MPPVVVVVLGFSWFWQSARPFGSWSGEVPPDPGLEGWSTPPPVMVVVHVFLVLATARPSESWSREVPSDPDLEGWPSHPVVGSFVEKTIKFIVKIPLTHVATRVLGKAKEKPGKSPTHNKTQ